MGCYLSFTDLLSHDDAAEESDGHVRRGVVVRGVLGEVSVALIQRLDQRLSQPASCHRDTKSGGVSSEDLNLMVLSGHREREAA